MEVLIDYREKNSGIPNYLRRIGVDFKFTNLPVSDYLVGDIGVERKEISDYIGSLADGRLHRQLYELSYNFELSYLCTIGYISEALLVSKFNRHAYISSLVGSSLKRSPDGKQGQVITVNLETHYDFAYFIKYLAEKVENYEPRVAPMSLVKKAYTDTDRIINIISAFPDISEVKARNILKKFGSIKEFVNAPRDKLMEVEGIGDIIADRLYKLINKEVEL